MRYFVRSVVLLLLSASSFLLVAQHTSSIQVPVSLSSAAPTFNADQMKKIGSGLLLQHLARKVSAAQPQGVSASSPLLSVAVYAQHHPSAADIAALEQLGVRCMPESWIPPLENHPLGFYFAQVPVNMVGDVLSLESVRRMDTAEREAKPLNNTAAVAVRATLAWAAGWTGDGVKVGVLDSGLDYTLPSTELPATLQCHQYAYWPDSLSSTFYNNTATGHGTHVTGTVLGRGGYSTSPVLNTGNGGGAYKGMAPAADLVFFKIGNNADGSATTNAEVNAIRDAVDLYGVRVINLSYGGWEEYHDGSDPISQAMDYAYSKGAACFVAAGNDADNARHYSGTVAANNTTDYIQIKVTGAGTNTTPLFFNLVWNDGGASSDLSVSYYNFLQIPVSSVTEAVTQSLRGTYSQLSYYTYYVPSGNSTFYLRVTNNSATPHSFHLYEAWGSNVTFSAPDPQYTVSCPAHADHVMAVAAYVSRASWTAIGGTWNWGFTQDDIAPFSNRGPRIDGVQKPNIAAPGSELISIRDRDYYTTPNTYYWVDNDGTAGGDANYYAMDGTSMASPVATGCAAVMLQHTPTATPQQVYDAMMQSAMVDSYTGSVPNSTWGYGKLDVNAALGDPALPVELSAFTVSSRGGSAVLSWHTASEVNNLGFDVERKRLVSSAANPSLQSQAAWTKVGFVAGHGTDNQPHEYSFTDRSIQTGRCAYRLKQIDRDGKFAYSTVVETSPDAAPLEFALAQNYPNPFNPSTSIEFSVAVPGPVHLAIYDLLGRRTAELVQKTMEPGSYSVEWNASGMPSGVYFYRLEAGSFTAVKKLLLQK